MKMKILRFVGIIAFIYCSFTLTAQTTVTCPVIGTASVYSGMPNTNFSGLAVGDYDNEEFRCLVVFDISAIPPNSDILDAEMRLTYSQQSDWIGVNLHRISSSWSASSVTWNNFPNYITNPYGTFWTTNGTIGYSIYIPVDEIVEEWIENGESNWGILLKKSGGTGMAEFFAINASPEYKPLLEVTYTDPEPHITLSPSIHDFGEEYVGDCTSPYSFTLTNDGAATATGTVYLTDINADQFEITSGAGNFSLSPDETKIIEVRFCPTSTGEKFALLYADGDSPCNNANSDLYGTGVEDNPSITLTPSSHNYGEVYVDDCSNDYSFTLENVGGGTATGNVSLTGSYANQFYITSNGGNFSLSPNETKIIKVKFCPTSIGNKTANLYANGSNCNNASSSLYGIGIDDDPYITLTPSSHNYGEEYVGDCSNDNSFTLKNVGGGTATGNVSLTGSYANQFYITSNGGNFSLSPNETKIIKVKFCPTSIGNKTANLYANGSNCNNASSLLYGMGVLSDLDPPTNLQATVNDDDVHLTWETPGGNQPEWLSYNDGTFETSFCSTNGGAGIAQLFTISEPCTIKKIRFFVDSYGGYNQEIEVNILSGNGATVLSGPHIVNGVADDWITIDINDIYVTNNFMVSTFNVISDGPYIGVDDSFYNGTLYFGTIGNFTELSQYGYEYIGSHEAYVEYNSDNSFKEVTKKNIIPVNSDFDFSNTILLANTNKTKKKSKNNNQYLKGLLGYNIYRNGNKINSYTITNTYYDDNNLQPGTYEYCATAVYSEGESGFSNCETVFIEGGNPYITLTPSSHDYGEEYVGDCSNDYFFTLENVGGGTATGSILLTGSNANEFNITSGSGNFSLVTNQTKIIKVKFCPTSIGNKTANLYANGTSPCNDAEAPLLGNGIYYLYVAPPELVIGGYAGDSSQFSINSNISWTISDYPSWLDISIVSGQNDKIITVTASSTNETGSPKIAVLSISGSEVETKYVEVTQEDVTGINDNYLSKFIKIFPNPANDKIYIKTTETGLFVKNIEILDVIGKSVYQSVLNNSNNLIRISLIDFQPGFYFIKLHTSKGVITKKIIIQR